MNVEINDILHGRTEPAFQRWLRFAPAAVVLLALTACHADNAVTLPESQPAPITITPTELPPLIFFTPIPTPETTVVSIGTPEPMPPDILEIMSGAEIPTVTRALYPTATPTTPSPLHDKHPFTTLIDSGNKNFGYQVSKFIYEKTDILIPPEDLSVILFSLPFLRLGQRLFEKYVINKPIKKLLGL